MIYIIPAIVLIVFIAIFIKQMVSTLNEEGRRKQENDARSKSQLGDEFEQRTRVLSIRENQEKIKNGRTNAFQELKREFQRKYDSDLDGNIDLLKSDLFRNALQSHQSKIQGLEKDILKNFVKLGHALSDRAKTVENLFSYMLQLDIDQMQDAVLKKVDADLVREVVAFVQENPADISTSAFQRRFAIDYSKASELMGHLEDLGLVSQFEGSASRTLLSDVRNSRYDKLIWEAWAELEKLLQSELAVFAKMQYNAIHMLNALLDDDMISFYEIYELFDRLQVWQSNYENLALSRLKSIDNNISNLRGAIEELTSEMISSLSEVTAHLEIQNSTLENIEGGLAASNLLTAVNTYQFHRRLPL